MSESRDDLYLQHILDAIEKIERYVSVGYEEFMEGSNRNSRLFDRSGERLSCQSQGSNRSTE